MHRFQPIKKTLIIVKDLIRGGFNNQLMTFVAYGDIVAKANRPLVLSQFLENILKENVLVIFNMKMCSK